MCNMTKILFFTFSLAMTVNFVAAENSKEVKIPSRSIPGMRVNRANSRLIEMAAKRYLKTPNQEKVIMKYECYKKWRVRGTTSIKDYQCDPISIAPPDNK